MAACEKCWRDANERVMHLGGSVVDRYNELLKERESNPCTPEQRRGALTDDEFWNRVQVERGQQ